MKFPFPIRYSIPVALLIFGLIIGVFSYYIETSRAERGIEEEISNLAASLGSRTASAVEYNYDQGDMEGAELEVVLLGTVPGLRLALVCDEADRIVHSSSYELKGRFLNQTPLWISQEALDKTRSSLTGESRTSADRQTRQAFYPIRLPPLPGELRASRTGVLILEFDLAFARQKAVAEATRRSLAVGLVITLLGLAVWLYFTLALTRRVSRLVRATQVFAEGRVDDFATLAGSDELAQVSEAFARMTQEIRARSEKLTEANRSLLREVVERQMAEEALRQSERRFRETLENMKLIALLLDTQGRVTFCNDYFLDLTGYEREEVMGKDWFAQFIPDGCADVKRVFVEGIHSGSIISHYENPIRTKSGELRHIRWSNTLLRDENRGTIIGTTSIGEDITERRKAEEDLRKSEELYRSLIEDARDAIVTFAIDGTFSSINPAFETILGWGREEWIGKPFAPLVHSDDLPMATEMVERALRGERPPPAQLRIMTKSGRQALLEAIATPQIRDGEIIGVMGVGRDMTERQLLEDQLRQAQKMESIGQLAGGVAHDFNNILTVIQGHALLIHARKELPDEIKDSISEIEVAAKRASNLTRQLLTFSRRQIIQPREIDLNEVVSDISNMLRRILGEDITLQVESSSGLPLIRADVGMMEQIIMNLAVNSRDAMPDGGRLRLTTTAETIDKERARHNAEAEAGHYVCLSVSDTGCGIAEEHLSSIFEPFFTTKEVGKGTGLGLATVYGIVKQHRGWIEVASREGEGTAFTIYLPAIEESVEAEATKTEEERVRGGDETILVVEDEESLRRLMRSILEMYGYRVLEAESGPAALKVWDQHGSEIDLLLTDMVMPEGMTGTEIAQKLKERRPDLKTVFTSGYIADFVGKNYVLSEELNFIQKPFLPDRLARTIRNCLDHQGE